MADISNYGRALNCLRNSLCLTLSFFPTLLSQKEIVILTYHSIGSDNGFYTVRPNDFLRQMEYLSDNCVVVPLAELLEYVDKERNPEERIVSITFDDGYQDFYLNAYPFLRRHNLPATVFIATGYVGGRWPFVQSHPKMLTWKQIEEISNNNIEIGAHSVTHPNLQEESSDKIEFEITESKQEIERHLRKTVQFFSYPSGRYTSKITQTVEHAGFKAGVCGGGTVQKGSRLFNLSRVQVDSSITFLHYRAQLTKAADWSRKIELSARILLRKHRI